MEFGVSCIGTRNPTQEMRERCVKFGAWVVRCGGQVHSGNAEGIDFAFAEGGNSVDPTQVFLHLPWSGFNDFQINPKNCIVRPPYPEWMVDLTVKLHPRGPYLKRGALALHTRNVSILHRTILCVAAPSNKVGGGGTGQGMRIAHAKRIELINLNHYEQTDWRALAERIRTGLR
jgi:hypothetical protein